MGPCLLEVRNIHTYYGLAHVLQGISLTIETGEGVGLLGRNGEGKTTILKSIMSILCPKEGEIYYQGKPITGLPSHMVSRMGISMVPEGRHIFPALNVIEHLRVPVLPAHVNREDLLKRVFRIFPELEKRGKVPARTLSGGQQQMLVIARSLMTMPKLLLLDEPMEGLSPKAVKRVIEALKGIREEGVTLLFTSTNCERAFPLGSRAYIIEKGKVMYHGSREDLTEAAEIQQRYLGVRG
jgi:branched-chain amino acid transport system ATP-binding protein